MFLFPSIKPQINLITDFRSNPTLEIIIHGFTENLYYTISSKINLAVKLPNKQHNQEKVHHHDKQSCSQEYRVVSCNKKILEHQFHCFFGYSLAPNIVDPILTLVLPSSTCINHQDSIHQFHSLLLLYFEMIATHIHLHTHIHIYVYMHAYKIHMIRRNYSSPKANSNLLAKILSASLMFFKSFQVNRNKIDMKI